MDESKKKDTAATRLAKSLQDKLMETLKSLEVKSNSAKGALARGKVFQIAGYLQEAAEAYREALTNDPEMDEAAARLVVVQLASGHKEAALETALRLASRSPNFAFEEVSSDQKVSAMTVLGDALVHNDRIKDAVAAYKLSDDTFAPGRLAQVYLTTGEPEKALEQVNGFASNTRYRDLTQVLALGAKSPELLPSYSRPGLLHLDIAMPGRPMLVDGSPLLAPVVWGHDEWCADPNDLG